MFINDSYRISEYPCLFSKRLQTIKDEVFKRLLPRGKRESTFTGPEPDGKTPFLDTFENTPNRPYAICLAKAVVNSWIVSDITIYPNEILVGVPRPNRPLYEHFSWGISFNPDFLEHPSYKGKKEEFLKRYEKLKERLNPLDITHVEKEGVKIFGSLEKFKALESMWWVAGFQGHTIPGYDKLLQLGIKGVLDEIEHYEKVNTGSEARVLYEACRLIFTGLSQWISLYAEQAEKMAAEADIDIEKTKYLEIAETCRAISLDPPVTLRQAAQLVWFYSLWDWVDCLGRCDQYFYTFYKRDMQVGRLSNDEAFDIIAALWLKFLEHGVHNITLGGQTSDGNDAANELTYMMLEISRTLHETHPRISVRVHKDTSAALLDLVVKMWSEGMADPTIVNDDIVIKGYTHYGVPIKDARGYSMLACQEIEIPGKSNMGCEDGVFNLAKCFELAFYDGRCRFTGMQLGPNTGDPRDFKRFEDLWNAYKTQVEFFVKHFIVLNNLGVEIRSKNVSKLVKMPLTDYCIQKGLDPDNGGAVYNFGEAETAGLGAVADSLTAVKHLVFDNRMITMEQLVEAIEKNYCGMENIRQMLLNKSPKYGNDDMQADEMAVCVAEHFWNEISKYKSRRGDVYYGACSLLEGGIGFGKKTWAMPDGRKTGEPLGNTIGPRTGADKIGPTAMLRSVAKLPLHKAIGGATCNVKLPASLMNTQDSRRKIASLIRSHFSEGGLMVQVTPVDSETLKDAQAHPESYPDLIVRVGGYSAKFIDLSNESQNEIIARS